MRDKRLFAVKSIAGVLLILAALSASAQSEKVLYMFQGGSDGGDPSGPLTFDTAGNIYGTTVRGGGGCTAYSGCGTVFKLAHTKTTWAETILYTFTGGSDGFQPLTGVVFDKLGNLYGGTGSGGNSGCYADAGCGSVFELTSSGGVWTEKTLYTFTGGLSDSGASESPLVFDAAGNIFSTARFGGVVGSDGSCYWGSGAVFELTQAGGSWTDHTLYSFTCGNDGGDPYNSRQAFYKGNLYGTTTGGGQSGAGVVFEIENLKTSPKEVVLYTFTGGSDGAYPYGAVVHDSVGNLYGTTYAGGAYGYGTVFKLTPSGSGWTETVLYSFTGGSDGAHPGSTDPVLDAAGNIYGTTYSGGLGSGVVWELVNSGGSYTYKTVYSFAGGTTDGAQPVGLVLRGGKLFGNTFSGGAYGLGIVYEVTP